MGWLDGPIPGGGKGTDPQGGGGAVGGRGPTAELDSVPGRVVGGGGEGDLPARVGLTGLLSDEHTMFRVPRRFRGLPIEDVLLRYDRLASRLRSGGVGGGGTGSARPLQGPLVPMTHQTLGRDRDLARHMLDRGEGGVILGGHEHETIHEVVTAAAAAEGGGRGKSVEDASRGGFGMVHIVKTGQDAERCAVVDLVLEHGGGGGGSGTGSGSGIGSGSGSGSGEGRPRHRPVLRDVAVHFEELAPYEPDARVERILRGHLRAVEDLEDSPVIDAPRILPAHFGTGGGGGGCSPPLSSERCRYQQTTLGGLLCQAVKTELEADACVINGAPIKASRTYPDGIVCHDQLKEELPFPLKMVVVEMTRGRLEEAIRYSRTQIEDGGHGGDGGDRSETEVERRGYLQVDFDYRPPGPGGGGFPAERIRVALPRNLMGGFCGIRPLIDLGNELRAAGKYPERDDYMKAIDLVVRFCCKERWATVMGANLTFDELDLDGDGKIDETEVSILLEAVLGEDPDRHIVADMISAIDTDGSGSIERGEFDELFEQVQARRGE